MRVLFDTNVVLDLLLDRSPFAGAATGLAARVERGILTGMLCATTITTIHYLVAKATDAASARVHVGKLLHLFDIAPVTRSVLHSAFHLGFEDFEDAVIHESAQESGAEAIVTRDGTDFGGARLSIYAPDELLSVLMAAEPKSN